LGEGVGDGFGDGGVGHAQADGDAGDLAADVSGGHGGDDRCRRTQGVDLAFCIFEPWLPPVEFAVGDHVG
jgi:hypothetical protein